MGWVSLWIGGVSETVGHSVSLRVLLGQLDMRMHLWWLEEGTRLGLGVTVPKKPVASMMRHSVQFQSVCSSF